MSHPAHHRGTDCLGKTLHVTEGTFKELMMFRKRNIPAILFLLIHSQAFELSRIEQE